MSIHRALKVARNRAARLRKEASICYRAAGPRALVALAGNLFFGFPKQLSLRTDGLQHPLIVRLRTSDAATYEDIFLEKEYDHPVSFSPRTIVDVGANCGMTTVFYANRFPDARVIALEPEASNFVALLRNTRAYPNIHSIRAALWSQDGQVEVFPGWAKTASWGKWGFRVREGSGCRAVTLPNLMRELGINAIDILKIDVEGAEREIFVSCDWMDKVKFLAIELHDRFWPGCSDAVEAVAGHYRRSERGSVTFYSR